MAPRNSTYSYDNNTIYESDTFCCCRGVVAHVLDTRHTRTTSHPPRWVPDVSGVWHLVRRVRSSHLTVSPPRRQPAHSKVSVLILHPIETYVCGHQTTTHT